MQRLRTTRIVLRPSSSARRGDRRQRRGLGVSVAAVVCGLTAASCSGPRPQSPMLTGAGTAHATTAVAGRSAATPGEPASSLASAVPTCVSRALSRTDRSSAALRAVAGAGVPIASAQVCVLRERPVAIVSFATPAQRAAAQSAVQAVLAYYSAGATWLAVPVGEGAPAGQLSAVQDVAAALGGSLHHGAAGA